MTLRVGVLGAGSFGTTIAHIISHNAPVVLWCRREETAREVNTEHTNTRYLPNAKVARSVRATASLEEAVRDSDVLVVGIPSHHMREVLEQAAAFIRPWVPVVSLAKGLEPGSQLRMTEVMHEVLPDHPAGVLTGPNLAKEIMAGYASASVVAFERSEIARQLQGLFKSGLFRVYTNHDVVGCELGGALKNVMAIAVGMGYGLGVGDNTRSAVITRGLAELTRLGVAMGGERPTFSGLTGMGDLIATCTSPQSRNRHVGEELGKGRSIEDIIAEMNQVAEGINTTRVVMDLAGKHGVGMPISREVYEVLYGESTARDAYRGLTRGDPGAEGDPTA